mmetsp:Transcript_43555/g.131783  ORF Transcript_43555/g.131783 Transcript_43555/m.131783 type:complete len:327 (+) Transcript_43555:589-1569(+)
MDARDLAREPDRGAEHLAGLGQHRVAMSDQGTTVPIEEELGLVSGPAAPLHAKVFRLVREAVGVPSHIRARRFRPTGRSVRQLHGAGQARQGVLVEGLEHANAREGPGPVLVRRVLQLAIGAHPDHDLRNHAGGDVLLKRIPQRDHPILVQLHGRPALDPHVVGEEGDVGLRFVSKRVLEPDAWLLADPRRQGDVTITGLARRSLRAALVERSDELHFEAQLPQHVHKLAVRVEVVTLRGWLRDAPPNVRHDADSTSLFDLRQITPQCGRVRQLAGLGIHHGERHHDEDTDGVGALSGQHRGRIASPLEQRDAVAATVAQGTLRST